MYLSESYLKMYASKLKPLPPPTHKICVQVYLKI